MYLKVTHLSNSMEFQDSSLPANVFVFAGMSGLSSNFGMPVSMYSGQAAVAQTAMSMSSMPGGSSLYFCFESIPVYLYLYFLGMSPMSAMSAAGLAATSAATNSYPVLFVYSCFIAWGVCISCASFVFEFFLYLKFFSRSLPHPSPPLCTTQP